MNAQLQKPTHVIGQLIEGGFFAGFINFGVALHGLVVAPKAEGEHKPAKWSEKSKSVAAGSWHNGLSNTRAMAEGGSPIAEWALALKIGGYEDWYIPALDELELLYRAFKPGTDENSVYGRSGINVSAVPPTYPYTLTVPAQTGIEAFRAGGDEAFAPKFYWSSTQHPANADYAYGQHFGNGNQDVWRKDNEYRVRAVRSFRI